MNEMKEFDDKLHLFNDGAKRIEEDLNNFLRFSESLLTKMLNKIPEHDYSIDTSKELSQQFFEIRDKIYGISQKMSAIRNNAWKVFYERQKKLLNEYHELSINRNSLPENSKERVNLNKLMKNKINEHDVYEKLQNCWGEDLSDRH